MVRLDEWIMRKMKSDMTFIRSECAVVPASSPEAVDFVLGFVSGKCWLMIDF